VSKLAFHCHPHVCSSPAPHMYGWFLSSSHVFIRYMFSWAALCCVWIWRFL